ncbi:MAG: carbamoyltransferase HypF [Gemmatimonadales bacterium]
MSESKLFSPPGQAALCHWRTHMLERRLIAVQGTVQGVGFRPFVYHLAAALELRGVVRNDSAGVLVDVEGEAEAIDDFVRRLTTEPPPLATIDSVAAESAGLRSYRTFRIAPSGGGPECTTLVSPDAATCDSCVAELFDPTNRRHRYPFITCTHCGPRLTITHAVPYDRPRTTMARFPMCDGCRREYEDPADRRFHAQPIACRQCGPTLRLQWAAAGRSAAVTGEGAIGAAATALRDGEILAIKGLGGYHLACDATSSAAVSRLRARKHREAKPLALMVANLEAARALCEVNEAEAALLRSPAAPVVLLAKRPGDAVAREVAPGNRDLGVMLPYTPLHHLLMAEAGRPLVMTSGNRTDEPIAFADEDAMSCLADVADGFLLHDRPISTRCDDSVMRVVRGSAVMVRRSRGHAPRPIRLAVPFPVHVLGTGGHLKNTFCLGKGRHAFLSHHIGDLENLDAFRALQEGITHYQRLFDIRPEIVAHDLHPDYLSTRVAEEVAGADRLAVQHHHAHVASCVAEHGVTEPVLGIVFDGAGLGADGAIWGGEFLLVEGAGYQRLAHLGYVPLPGGDAAARQPWKAAVAHLWAAYGSAIDSLTVPGLDALERDRLPIVRQMLARGINCPLTSSAGRLFDAVAALLGLRAEAQFEAQAAMELEMAADPTTTRSYPVELRETAEGWIVEPATLIRGVVEDLAAGLGAADIAGAFHNGVRDMVVTVVARLRRHSGISRVALTGGVFQNALLTGRVVDSLEREGCQVLFQQRVPCNDGGLSLGQAYVAGLVAAGGQLCV